MDTFSKPPAIKYVWYIWYGDQWERTAWEQNSKEESLKLNRAPGYDFKLIKEAQTFEEIPLD